MLNVWYHPGFFQTPWTIFKSQGELHWQIGKTSFLDNLGRGSRPRRGNTTVIYNSAHQLWSLWFGPSATIPVTRWKPAFLPLATQGSTSIQSDLRWRSKRWWEYWCEINKVKSFLRFLSWKSAKQGLLAGAVGSMLAKYRPEAGTSDNLWYL